MIQSFLRYLLKTGKAGNPIAAYFMVNEMCNLRCNMCHIWQGVYVNKDEEILSLEQIEKIIDELAEAGLRAIMLTGGEPLLRKDLIEILTYVNQKIPYCRLTTNATLIGPEAAEGLVRSGLDELWLSLDGYGETHDKIRGVPGTFDRFIRGLESINLARKRFNSKTPNVMINMTVSKYNIHEMLKVAEVAAQYDARELNFGYVIDVARGPVEETTKIIGKEDIYTYQWNSSENLFVEDHKLSKETKDKIRSLGRKHHMTVHIDELLISGAPKRNNRSCYFMWLYTMITPHGYMIPCQMIDKYYLGDLKTESFKSIWNSAEFQRIRGKTRQGLPICTECCIPRRNISDQMQSMANFKRVFVPRNFRNLFYKGSKSVVPSDKKNEAGISTDGPAA